MKIAVNFTAAPPIDQFNPDSVIELCYEALKCKKTDT